MAIFNFISNLCSIIGLLISIFTVSKIIKIQNYINMSKNINNNNEISQNNLSNNSKIVGGNEG